MNLVEIKEVGIKRYLPSHLAECDIREYVMMARLLYGYHTKQIQSIDQLYAYAVYALLDIKPNQRHKLKHSDAHHENLALLSNLVESFFEEIEGVGLQIVQDYTRNPMSYFYLYAIKYIGPEDHFQNVTFGQYMDGLTKVIEYHEYGEEMDLYRLLAIFYQPKIFGKKRPYIPTKAIKTAKIFHKRKLDFGFLYGFYLYFTSMNRFITSAKVPYEGREIDLSIIFESDEEFKSDLPGIGIRSNLHSIAKSGVFGTEAEVREKSLWDVLFLLYDLRKQDIDEKKARKASEQKSKSKSKRK